MKKILKYSIYLVSISIIFIIIYLSIDLDKNKIDFYEVEILIEQNYKNYASVTNSEELILALENDDIHIIELKNDIDLGYNLIEQDAKKSNYVKKHNIALTHPMLKQTGVSKLMLQNKNNLVIYSKNGYKLLHTNIVIENSKNIKIDNIKMEELWEWDEATKAEYDRNDWDYITIKYCENIQIKNCEFSKCYDGVTDIKNSKNITIEYCKLNEIDIDKNVFFNKQFEELENNIDKYPMYNYLRTEVGLDLNKIKELSAYQFKLYLIDATDSDGKNENIVIHNNAYLNVKTRIPRAINSSVYLYNIYTDSNKINYNIITKEQRKKIKNKYPKIVALKTFGAISTNRSYVVLENVIFDGVKDKYVIHNEISLKNIGKIVIKQDEKKLHDLKEMIINEAGNKIYN